MSVLIKQKKLVMMKLIAIEYFIKTEKLELIHYLTIIQTLRKKTVE